MSGPAEDALSDHRPDSPGRRRRLARLAGARLNYDPDHLAPVDGFQEGIRRVSLPGEPAGEPTDAGSWSVARGLVADYAFADPSTIRAYYEPRRPQTGRDMLLRLRSLKSVSVYVGTRVQEVIDEPREIDGQTVRIWGWTYGTLEGHVESGEMSWQVWKWLDSGEVQFTIHWISRPAQIANPVIALGFKVVSPHEREHFLVEAGRRMQRLTAQGLS